MKVLKLPGSRELRQVNDQLRKEVEMRKLAEEELLRHQEKLEGQVESRTYELEIINEQLLLGMERREAIDQKIKESEQRYHELYEQSPDMYVSVEPVSARIRECNQTMADELGYSKEALVGEPIFNYCTSSSMDKASRVFGDFKESGLVRNAELQLQRKDGSHIDVMLKAVAVYDDEGEMIASRASLRDVTALKVAREAIQEGVARIIAIVDNAVDAIITIDDGGIIESFNPAAERIFGYEAYEVIGQNIKLIMPQPYRDEHDHYLDNYRETGMKKVIGVGREVEGQHRNGHTFPLELSISELNVNGKHLYTGIVRDITKRKMLEQVKDEFVSIVSHELRTPLTSINGSLGLITSGMVEGVPETLMEMVGIAKRNCERLIRLINDLLDLQKMESGGFEIVREPHELEDLLLQSMEAIEGYAETQEVVIKLDDDSESCGVQVDSDRMLQVMTNLLSNAAKFSPRDGTISVRAHVLEDRVRVSIHDDGDGIPLEMYDRIFEKFQQADSSIRRTKGGTGLGLNITKRIVEMHGGTIAFESAPDAGTTFFFELPLHVKEQETA
jgi:PAS domain S-box-containing protein